MAITLPLPFRVAAGILGTGIDLVRALPDDIPALPVTLVGNAMKLTMKVQQEIATLASRGDELLGGVIGGPVENPSWAKFDDDEPSTPVRPVSRLKTAPPVVAPKPPAAERDGHSDEGELGAYGAKPESAGDESTLTTPDETSMPPGTTIAMDAAIEVDAALIEEALVAIEDAQGGDGEIPTVDDELPVADDEVLVTVEDVLAGTEIDLDSADVQVALTVDPTIDPEDFDENPVVFEETTELTEGLEIPAEILDELGGDIEPGTQDATDEPDRSADGPAALPGYDGMTLAQVRGHLRDLTVDDVSTLLRWEQDGDGRPSFLTLLSNRLVTLDAQDQ